MAELSKKAIEKAYKAGYALPGIDWTDEVHGDVPDEKRGPGVHHCPFSDDPREPDQVKQREAWLRGLKDRLEKMAAQKSPADVLAEIKEEIG